jgi:hypothetical protein
MDFTKRSECHYIFTSIKYIMESKHSGHERLAQVLHEIADFEILKVDDMNMGARKITDKTQNHADI